MSQGQAAELKRSFLDQFRLFVELLRWTPLAAIAGVMGGSASALLLWSLEVASVTREAHKWLILLLAPVGWLVGLTYDRLGRSVQAGNNLILEEVHSPKKVIPIRMTPLVLLGTFLTHLFGGSAGREGTAIQAGASLADQLTRPFKLDDAGRRILLMTGMSAGFGSVFGTPLSGAVFGLEVLAIGALTYEAIAPCFLAAFIGDWTTKAWGIHHAHYVVIDVPAMRPDKLLAAMVAGAAFGLAGWFFAQTTHALGNLGKRYIKRPEMRPFAGGLIVTAAVFGLGTTKYIGLGLPTIAAAFTQKLPWYDFLVKSLFTSVTLGAGFKGGEVTPLFFVGATLGNALSHLLPLSASLLAGMGFVAVFGGAANTPIASTLMAMELFGPEAGAFAAIACVGSYLFSGHSGIYRSQRIGRRKRLGAASYNEVLPEPIQAKMHVPDPHETPHL